MMTNVFTKAVTMLWRGTPAVLILAAFAASCTPSEPLTSEAVRSFKKEVQETKASLTPALVDAVASREPRRVKTILDQNCLAMKDRGQSFSCGVTVLDRHGITLASASPGEPVRRLDYSRYEVVMRALKNSKPIKAKLFLQDRTTLYAVGFPLAQDGEAAGLLVLTFDAQDLKNRYGLTEEAFLKVDLDR